MLAFFRRFERYIYMVITFFVLISFSFFGSFGTLNGGSIHEVQAFTDLNGQHVGRTEVEQLVAFLTSDADDKVAAGGFWGPNFLNDGVIKKDILATGLGGVLVEQFGAQLGDELQVRLEREKRYEPYRHPQAPFVNAESVWGYFAPEINSGLLTLKAQQDALSADAFKARVDLFLSEQRFPSPLLRQVLSYQQRQYRWIKPDNNLLQRDLALFGYKRLDDWFGPRFVRLAAEFILNSAIVAEQRGYQVSGGEAMADLMRNAALSYEQHKDNANLGVANAGEYFNEQLRRLGLDANGAADLWRKVLLFRRLFRDTGGAAFVDRYSMDKLASYAYEAATGTSYTLPEGVQLSDFEALQQFEIYLRAVAKKPKEGEGLLALPREALSLEQVAARHPSLVKRIYSVELAAVDKHSLEGRVSIKDMWQWQVTDKSWRRLQEQFPVLANIKASDAAARSQQLDGLDELTRNQVNQFSRAAIVDEHPEWLGEALSGAPSQRMTLELVAGVPSDDIKGLSDGSALIELLQKAPVGGELSQQGEALAAQTALQRYSADGKNYYRITLVEAPRGQQLLTFAEARKKGVLTPLVDKALEGHYSKLRERDPAHYQQADGSWKPLQQVRNDVAMNLFAPLLRAINGEAAKAGVIAADEEISGWRSASLRFLAFVEQAHKAAQSDEHWQKDYVAVGAGASLADQWRLRGAPFEVVRAQRQQADEAVDTDLALSLPSGGWSSVNAPGSGALSFFQVEGRAARVDDKALVEKVMAAQRLLGDEQQRLLGRQLATLMQEKNAISLSFMDGAGAAPEVSEAVPLPPEY